MITVNINNKMYKLPESATVATHSTAWKVCASKASPWQ